MVNEGNQIVAMVTVTCDKDYGKNAVLLNRWLHLEFEYAVSSLYELLHVNQRSVGGEVGDPYGSTLVVVQSIRQLVDTVFRGYGVFSITSANSFSGEHTVSSLKDTHTELLTYGLNLLH